MNIKIMDSLNSDSIEFNDVVNYVSQHLICLIDDDIRNKQIKLDDLKNSLQIIKSDMNQIKERNDILVKDLAREKQLFRVLSLLASLKKEGAIRGVLKNDVVGLLNKIDKLNYHELSKIEEKLSVYRSD